MSDSITASEIAIDEQCVVLSVITNDFCQSRCILKLMSGDTEFPGDWWLFDLQTKPQFRRQGHAASLMARSQIYAASKTPGASIFLNPRAFNDAPMPDDQLIAWYARLGFKPHTDGMCWRWESGD